MELCFVKFVVWLLVVSVGSEGKVAGRATCETTGLGEPARVTCHYRENVVDAFDVSAVSLFRDTDGKKEKVVECDRFLNNGFDCTPEAGYKLNGTISDQMIINILRAQPEHQGTYYCEIVIQQTEVLTESCDLQYKGKVAVRATCESTGPGEPARVTCHYRENVVKARDVSAVSLLRDTGGKEEKVVECDRFLNNGFDCTPEAGYKLNGIISDQMIINIPRARPEHQGTYFCELVIHQTEFQMGSCDLQYTEHDDAATSTSPSEQDSDNNLKRDTGISNATAWLIAVTVLVLLVIVILVFALVLFVRRRHRRPRNCRQQNTVVEKLGDKIDILLQAFGIDDGNSLCKKNFNQFPYNRTQVKNLLLGVSTGNKVGMAAKRPYNSEICLAAERTPFRTKDDSQRGDSKLRFVT